MNRILAVLLSLVSTGCSLPQFIEYPSEAIIIQYFEQENVCVVVGASRFQAGDTSWISHYCHKQILKAAFCYIGVGDTISILDSYRIRPAEVTEETIADTLYQVYHYGSSECCTCNYAIFSKGILGTIDHPVDYFKVYTFHGRIKKVVGHFIYS